MATFSKQVFSGSTLGRGIEIDETVVGSAVTIHQVANTVNLLDEVWLYAQNTAAQATDLTVWFGGVTAVDDQIAISVPSQDGLTLVVAGIPLGQNLIIKAHAERASEIIVYGYVNRLTP
jgi:hypothetical protein